MKKYIIYKITIIDTEKMYIGYTSNTAEFRINKHIVNAKSGIKTKFYNALLKYNFNIVYDVILECDSKEKAHEMEKYYISQYNTYKNGYNSTIGGDGGFTITKDKYKKWIKLQSELNSGANNKNYSGYTDDEIIEAGVRFYKEIGLFTHYNWRKWAKTDGYPVNFTQCRFNNGGFKEFKKRVSDILDINLNDVYYKNESHKSKLADAIRGRKWVTDGIVNKQLKEDILEDYLKNGWILGRTIKNK